MTPDEAIALLTTWVEKPAPDGEIADELIAATMAFDLDPTEGTRARMASAVGVYRSETHERVRVNLGGMGATWDLDDACQALRSAAEIRRLEWDHASACIFGHGLVAVVDGRAMTFGSRTGLDDAATRGTDLLDASSPDRVFELVTWMNDDLESDGHTFSRAFYVAARDAWREYQPAPVVVSTT